MLISLNARKKKYRKGEMIFHSGDVINTLCFVMAGSVTIESNDMWGIRTILNLVGRGQFFAESYALLPNEPMLVDACANEDCTIFSPDMKSTGRLDESIRARLLTNLLIITTRKNLHLSSRSFHTAGFSLYRIKNLG